MSPSLSQDLPSITVVIVARPDQADIESVIAARHLDYPADRLEILLARGKQASVQRNAAVKAAHGEWLYFLDDDSVPPPSNLRQAVRYCADPAVAIVGGPSLCPPETPLLEQVWAVALGSWLACGPCRSRYAAVGDARPTSEKELIGCNLLARREAILEIGGFNEAMFPSEENALMDRLERSGGRLIYDPQFVVYRRPRRSLTAFVTMLLTYGRGAAERFRLHPSRHLAPNLVPPLFCIYLLTLLALCWISPIAPALPWLAAPLLAYLLAVIVQTAVSMRRHGLARSLLAMPLLAASHLFYGLGFCRGLFTRLHRPLQNGQAQVVVERVDGEDLAVTRQSV